MLNKVMLIGNVGKDPEIRYLDGNNAAGGNTKVATITLATSERYRDRNGETKETTEWHNVIAWRNLADLADKFIRKGTQIYVEGKLRTRSWTDQSGNKRYTTEIQADTIQLLGRKGDNPASQQAYSPSQPQAPYGQGQQQSYNPAPAYQPQPAPQQAFSQAVPQTAGPILPEDGPDDDLPF